MEPQFKYKNRNHAGRLLAKKLAAYSQHQAIVLALPRGGVPVADEIAKALKLPMDMLLVRKLGVSYHPELAMGAIALGDIVVLNDGIITQLNISKDEVDAAIAKEQQELTRRNQQYRHGMPFKDISDRVVILVDDGIATGATMKAAIQALRKLKPSTIIVAVPVAEVGTYKEIAALADEIYCGLIPEHFYSVGTWYENFNQLTDSEVCAYLKQQQDNN